jgi:hypothetical protein
MNVNPPPWARPPGLLSVALAVVVAGCGVSAFAPQQHPTEPIRRGESVFDPNLEFLGSPLAAHLGRGKAVLLDPLRAQLVIFDAQGTVTEAVDLGLPPASSTREPFGLAGGRDSILIGYGGHGGGYSSLLLFDASGHLLARKPLPDVPDGAAYSELHCIRNGWVLVEMTYEVFTDHAEWLQHPRIAIRPLDLARGRVGRSIAVWPDPSSLVRVNGVYVPQIEQMHTVLASEQSEPLAIARTVDYRIDLLPWAALPGREVVVSVEPVPVGERYRDSAIGAAERMPVSAETKEAMRKYLVASLLPKQRPVIGGLWYSPDGRLAVLRRDLQPLPGPDSSRHQVDILTVGGRLLRRVSLDRDDRILLFVDEGILTCSATHSRSHSVGARQMVGADRPGPGCRLRLVALRS